MKMIPHAVIRGVLLLSCLLVNTDDISAQPAVNYRGITCGPPAPYGCPKISVIQLPRLGTQITVYCSDLAEKKLNQYVPPCYFTGVMYLAVGASTQSYGGLGLPFMLPLALTSAYPCFAWVSIDALLPMGGLGSPYNILYIPNDSRLVGVKVYLQWYVNTMLIGSCYPHQWNSLVTSDYAELTLGW